jgi:hypothetical protein
MLRPTAHQVIPVASAEGSVRSGCFNSSGDMGRGVPTAIAHHHPQAGSELRSVSVRCAGAKVASFPF